MPKSKPDLKNINICSNIRHSHKDNNSVDKFFWLKSLILPECFYYDKAEQTNRWGAISKKQDNNVVLRWYFNAISDI